MAKSTWSSSDWVAYAATTQQKTQQQIFTQNGIHKDMNPYGVKMREARDSDLYPESTPIIVALDETGSMGEIPEKLCKGKLGILVDELLTRKPVTDPQLMFMGVGDAYSDKCPIQVGQFESDNTMIDWLEKIYLEKNGGGNGGESYLLAWYFAAFHTSIDSFEKRGKKGFLFTIGDEHQHMVLTKEQIREFFGDNVEKDFTRVELLQAVSKYYNVFHLIITEGWSCDSKVVSDWKTLLKEKALEVDNYENVAEVIVSTLQLCAGADKTSIVKSWSDSVAMTVSKAVNDLVPETQSSEVVRF